MTNPSQPLSTSSPDADACMFCHQSLRITTSADDDADTDSETQEGGAPSTVIDDVELYCGPPGSGPSGHHAHWTCLIEHATVRARSRGLPGGASTPSTSTFASPVMTCVVCGQNVVDPSGRFVVDVRNEGGETKGFDFGAIIEEELFLDSYPNQLHNRAFHDLVAQGDYAGAIDLIAEHDVDINCTYGQDGLTALQKAMFSGDMSGVEFLRSLGATV